MADLTVEASVLTWLESHPAFLVNGARFPVGLECQPETTGSGVMLQSLSGDPYVRRYKSGGYIAAYPFAVYLRVRKPDTSARSDAMKALGDLGRSIDTEQGWPAAPEGYEFISLALRTTPVRVAVDDAATDDYQATFNLTYRKRG